jgi:hypothetical protein
MLMVCDDHRWALQNWLDYTSTTVPKVWYIATHASMKHVHQQQRWLPGNFLPARHMMSKQALIAIFMH